MEKVKTSRGRNFLKEYPITTKVNPPKLMIRKLTMWCFTIILLILNLVMLCLFATTFIGRRFFQLIGLVDERSQGKKFEIKPMQARLQGLVPRVCVIGCGASGLAAVKECVENGLEVVAYDINSGIGGVFACAYEDGYFTSSNIFTAFSSFPCDVADLPARYWSFEEYQDYLRRFVAHFNLEDHLNLGYRVNEVTETDENKWRVVVTKCSTMEESSSIYDHVVVCTGTNREAATPDYSTSSSFHGQIIHSSQYHSAKPLAGKRVLVVGLGESAADIAFNVSQEAANVCIIARSGPGAVIPRYHAGMPSDTDSTRAYHSFPRSLARLSTTWWKLKLWLDGFYNLEEDDELNRNFERVNFSEYFWMFRYGTKSANFVWVVTQNGGHYMETSILKLDESGAVMENGSRYDCDVIIYCSGYQGGISFLPPELANLNYRNDLWKKTIHPKFGNRIAFIGFARPNIGAIPPIAEFQARFVALAIAGRIQMLSDEEMRITIEAERAYEEWLFPYDFKRVPSLCSYLETMTSWAWILNCDVCYWKLLFTSPRLLHRVIFGPILAAQYRLFGEGSNYNMARQALTISAIRPIVLTSYCALVLLTAAVLSNFGLCDPLISFPLP